MKDQRWQRNRYDGRPPEFGRRPKSDRSRSPHYDHRAHGYNHPPGFRRKRRFLYRQFLGFAIFMALPLLAVGIFLGIVISGQSGDDPMSPLLALAVICGLPVLLVLLAVGAGSWVFRGVGTPLANVMAAADALAEGDLSVRTSEQGSREFRRLARSFNRMAEELERDELRRRNLTADVAHELRTPLHILQGNLEGILDGVYEPTDEQIQAMLDETHLLTRLVDDLQTLSQAEADQLSLQMEQVDVGDLLRDVRTSFGGLAEAVAIDLQVDVPDAPPDYHRRCRATEPGVGKSGGQCAALHPDRWAHHPGSGINPERVRISVSDTGEGIPAEDLPYVFDRFWRGDRSRTRAAGTGSGLGLAIARQLVRAQQGQISVESVVGQGTTFVIELPTAVV